jgi:hypothetical protein
MEHPDITAALRTGYPRFWAQENQDTPENRADYIAEHRAELVAWLRAGYPEVLEEFLASSGQACMVSYETWLN